MSLKDGIADMDDNITTPVAETSDVSIPAETPQAVEPAASSAATDVDHENDLLKVVRDVVGDPTLGAAPSAENATAEDADAGAEAAEGNEPKEDYSDVPFGKHPRFKQLLTERNNFKVDADRYQNIERFLQDSGLASDEAANGLQIMALAKTNPAEAWKQIQPWVQSLLIAAGEVLPQDLQEQVHSGQMTLQVAQEVSRSRANVKAYEAREQFATARRSQQEQTDLQNSLVNAASTWEQERTAKDPNFAGKYDALQREVYFMQRQEGFPNTPEGVRAMLDKAYAAVNATAPTPQPVPQPRNAPRPAVTPVRSGAVTRQAAPAPNSTEDVLKNVLSKHGVSLDI